MPPDEIRLHVQGFPLACRAEKGDTAQARSVSVTS